MAGQTFRLGLTFDDVLLEPRESAVLRNKVSLETQITKKIKIAIPIISAAMDTVSGPDMAIALGSFGGLSILHRNCSIEEQVKMLKKVKKAGVMVGAAIGGTDLERAKALDKARADVIVIDVAHAHVKAIIKSAKQIKKATKAQLIVGNIATKEAAAVFALFADALKVGVGAGSICTTRVVTGVGVPQLTAIVDVVSVAKKYKTPVIADGGIKYSGDAVKALAAGASSVMLGSLLAGTKETPGRVIKIKSELYKEYRGMGSLGVMKLNVSTDRYFQKGSKTFIPEGIEARVKYKGPVKNTIDQITGGIRSGMGYLGARTIADIPKRAKFIRITNAGLRESHPHSVIINKKAPNY